MRRQVAVVGLACRMPGAADAEAFWRNLAGGVCSVAAVPAERWRAELFHSPDRSAPNKSVCMRAGLMSDVDCFDAAFFKIAPREAESMDPQQRIMLELAWSCMEDAGIPPSSLEGKRVGVYIGLGNYDYKEIQDRYAERVEGHFLTGTANTMVANRVSHFFNFRGPSLTVDTACSSSLYAIQLAHRALLAGDCDLALAGGISVFCSPERFIPFSKLGMLSPDGLCRTFDAGADGYVRGEGAGLVLLQTLDDAGRERRRIDALIPAVVASHGGRARTLTSPNAFAQASAVIESCRRAGFGPDTISYVEAHGTGTPLGDPIEIQGLKRAFRTLSREFGTPPPERAHCGLGTVKTNIGHLESAAGIAGLIKVLLAMRHRKLPPILHLEALNPSIELAGSPFFIVDKLTDWRPTAPDGTPLPLRAGVSSFGFGGANSHLLLEEYAAPRPTAGGEAQLLPLSALDGAALLRLVAATREYLRRNRDALTIDEVAYVLQTGREQLTARVALLVADVDEAIEALGLYARGESAPSVIAPRSVERPGVADESPAFVVREQEQLAEAAEAWVSNRRLDWSSFPRPEGLRPISLNTYPFQKERHWLRDINAETMTGPVRAQHVESRQTTSGDDGQSPGLFFRPVWREVRRTGRGASRKLFVVADCADEEFAARFAARTGRETEVLLSGGGRVTESVGDGGRADFCLLARGCGRRADAEHASPEDSAESAESIALDLFRRFKRLHRDGILTSDSVVWVVTQNVFEAVDDDVVDPTQAACVGLSLTVGRESPGAKVRCLDLPATLSEADWQSIAELLSKSPPAEVVLAVRRGELLARVLEPSPLPQATPKLRREGVYLILGGAGGLGLETAVWLAAKAGAQVALVGRSALDEEKLRSLRRIEEAGGRWLYVQADGADREQMARAVAEVRGRFGPVNGVIHSALALRDRTFAGMDEDDFEHALRPKVAASRVLCDVTRDEPLDFVVFYSSCLSFRGNRGQANYAAGCTFQDAFAAHLRRQRGHAVQTVNWGFWGEVGAVKSEQYHEKLAGEGVRPLTCREGLDALARVLASDLPQTVVMKTDAKALQCFGVESDSAVDDANATPDDAGAPARQLKTLVAECYDAESFSRAADGFAELEEWSLRRLRRVLTQAGLHPDELKAHPNELPARFRILPRYGRLAAALLALLDSAPLEDDAADYSFESYPALRSYGELVSMCLAALPGVLRGEVSAVDVLLGERGRELLGHVYGGGPLADFYNRLVAKSVRCLVEARRDAAHLEGGVRILEVGAGTGATTRVILEELEGSAAPLTYVYTDVSGAFLRDARARLGERYPFVEWRLFDVEQPASAAGFSPGEFDLIVGANVLHATRDLGVSVANLRPLLKPGGALVLSEATRFQAFTTLTFGLLEGWWRFEDETRLSGHSPLLSANQWDELLRASSFAQVVTLSPPANCAYHPSQSVIVAVNGGAPAPLQTSQQETRVEAAAHPAPSPAGTTTRGGGDVGRIAALIAGHLAEVTGFPLERIEYDRPFSDYGVDSLIGVDLVTALSKEFQTQLGSTALFGYPTIEKLSGRLRALGVRDESAAVPAPQELEPPAPRTPRLSESPAPVQDSPAGGFDACVLRGPCSPSELRLETVAPAEPGPDEVQIQVRAFALNFGDLLCLRGLYPTMPAYPFVPGFEVSGVVSKTGASVTEFADGDEVIAITGARLGGHAGVVRVPADYVVRKPDSLDFEAAAALPVAFLTAHAALERARVAPGEVVLIQTAAGGVGLMAVQLARLQGARVIGTAGSAEKCGRLLALGVEHAVNYREADFFEEAMRFTGGRGVDVVLNTLGGEAIQKGLNLLAPGGRYVEIAMTGLQSSGGFDLSRLVRNQSFHSLDVRRLLLDAPRLARRGLETMLEMYRAGSISPGLDRVFPLSDLREAYRYLEQRRNVGKVVVSVPSHAPKTDEPAATVSASAAPSVARASDVYAPIAVVGMSGRFAGAPNLDAFWKEIAAARSAVREVDPTRWAVEEHFDSRRQTPGKTYSKWGAFLEDADCFDSAFFRMSGREAELTDPQQRLFLEECWKAIEDAAINPEELAESRCGVFLGGGDGDYGERLRRAGVPTEAFTFLGNEASVCAARIAYHLNLKGPCMAISTACSSSLVALHYACRSLATGESDVALAGGVFVMTTARFHILCSQAGMLSPTGECRVFDGRADGFVPGEGVGVLVLKRLEQALADGDHVHAVILGTGVNQDGKTNGIMAPNLVSQSELEQSVYRAARIDPGTIGYVECHGTGTVLGDPVEIEGLTEAFRRFTAARQFCAVGSVKANIGHTVTAAGVAGVLKAVLALGHAQLPPSARVDELNPRIDFANSPFYVNRELRHWPADRHPRRAAVSSFGFSGTNAHVVLEQGPRPRPRVAHQAPCHLFAFSAKTAEALEEKLRDFLSWLDERGRERHPGDVSYTLLRGRAHFAHRVAFVCPTLHELAALIRAALAGERADGLWRGVNEEPRASVRRDLSTDILRNARESVADAARYREQLSDLGAAYARGATADWEILLGGRDNRRIPLPTYPFERERFWPADARDGEAPARAHEAAVEGESRAEYEFTPETHWVRDHVVADVPTLPGAFYVEAARATAEAAAKHGERVRVIKDVRWRRRFTVEHDAARLRVESVRHGNEAACRLYGDDDAPYAEMNVVYTASGEVRDAPPPLDLARVREACRRRRTGEWCRRSLNQRGLHYGPSFEVIESVRHNDDEALAVLRLPEGASTSELSGLHPNLIDGAWQVIACLLSDEAGRALVPVRMAEVEWFGELSSNVLAYVTRVGAPGETRGATFDCFLCDEAGRVLVRMKDLRLSELSARVGEPPLTHRTLFFGPVQKEHDASSADARRTRPSSVLVFDDGPELAEALSSRLQSSNGHGPTPVALATRGARFERLDAARFSVAPARQADYTALLDALDGANTPPDLIIVRAEKWAGDGSVARCFAPLFYLLKSLAARSGSAVRLMAVASGDDPADASLPGLLRAAALELKGLECQHLAFDERADAARISNLLLEEWSSAGPLAHEIRYEGERRTVRVLEAFAPDDFTQGALPLRRRGVYLITGGAGGVGKIFAEHLAGEYEATVVLAGRSRPDARTNVWLRSAAALGGAVFYECADVSDATEASRLVETIRARHGELRGVIHAAAVRHDGPLATKSVEEFEAVLAPKVAGALNLDRAVGEGDLDFFVLCSSVASVAGNAGQSDYCLANRFLEAFAFERERMRARGLRRGLTRAVAWPLWANGARVGAGLRQMMADRAGLYPMPDRVGLDIFDASLRAPFPSIVAAYGDPERVGDYFARASFFDAAGANVVPVPPPAASELQTEVESYLQRVLGEVLKIPRARLAPSRSFEDFGLDSVIAAQLTARLEREFGRLPETLFFEHYSIRELARHLLAERPREASRLCGPEAHAAPGEVESMIKVERAPVVVNEPAAPATPNGTGPRRADDEETRAVSHDAYDIAVVGLAGRYPDAPTLEDFWRNLREGRDSVGRLPRERRELWRAAVESDEFLERVRGGFLEDYDKFDSLFFNISPREAELMDPQERLFLETAWSVVEDAGYTREGLRREFGGKVGVFVGVMWGEYQLWGAGARGGPRPESSFASVPNRVSFALGLNGPSMAIDTMCSSSLTSLHLACQSIVSGESRAAIVGGVSLSVHPNKYLYLTQEKFLASDGRCRSFGEGGDGYVPGEGVGAVLLRPLRDALAAGDHVYGVVKGTAVNHGGRTHGYTVPDPKAQASAIAEALERARVPPDSISYIEAHGTGTDLGDPIEIRGIASVFRPRAADETPRSVGSVKSNIGHLESAAGVAGLTKVLLQFKHRELAPSLHSVRLNPKIDFSGVPFRVQQTRAEWRPAEGGGADDETRQPLRAGISSFGAGGSNAHVILEEFQARTATRVASPTPQLILLSAKNGERLREYVARLRAFAQSLPADAGRDLEDVAFTLQTGREHFECRLAVIAEGAEELAAKLESFLAGRAEAGMLEGTASDESVLGGLWDETARDWFAPLLDGRQWEKLAKLWVHTHAPIDWRVCHRGRAPVRISLPTYPFARQRCWLADAVAVEAKTEAGPRAVVTPPVRVEALPGEAALRDIIRRLKSGEYELNRAAGLVAARKPESA